MTTNVPRGAGRAAHTQRTAKAAQRTPLPPKPALPAAPIIDEDLPGGKKAALFLEAAFYAGWQVGTARNENEINVVATRTTPAGMETIVCIWTDGRAIKQPVHMIGDQVQARPRNVAAARTLLAIPADNLVLVSSRKPVTAEEASKSNKTDSRETRVLVRSVPWDNESADEEIVVFVAGREITWHNAISDKYETAVCPRETHKTHIYTSTATGERILSFASVGGGFRAVRINEIMIVA